MGTTHFKSKVDAVGGLALAGVDVLPTAAEFNKLDGIPAAGYLEAVAVVEFTETTGAGVYTGTISLPAGSFLLDVIWMNTALWTATTSATMKAGTAADDDMFFTAVNLKTGPAINVNGAGGISCMQGDAGAGAATGLGGAYFSVATDIVGVVTTVGAAGNAGRSLMIVRYATPVKGAAVKA